MNCRVIRLFRCGALRDPLLLCTDDVSAINFLNPCDRQQPSVPGRKYSLQCSGLEWPSADKPVAEAATLPSNWYLEQHVYEKERSRIFHNTWQLAANLQQLSAPGQYVTGSLAGVNYVVCRDGENQLRAFHNVCRHHAAKVAEGEGQLPCFTCPYHGWQYSLDGRLIKALRLKGIKDFKASQYGLVPISVDTWGPWVFINLQGGQGAKGTAVEAPCVDVKRWLGAGGEEAVALGVHDPLVHIRRRVYDLACNWKVFCDNYLDGGYHVAGAHPSLAAQCDLDRYSTQIYKTVSIQTCPPKETPQEDDNGREPGSKAAPQSDQSISSARLSSTGDGCVAASAYAFLYPNLMMNRYGPWLDTNLVLPTSINSCRVIFNYYLHPTYCEDQQYIESSLAASDQVQQEDIALCEAVQEGLQSPVYREGRYVPDVEGAMFQFHQMLYQDVTRC